MKNSIKAFSQRLLTAIAVVALTVFPGCQEEDKELPPSTIQFNASLQNVIEGGEATITLMLDRAAPSDGSVTVTIETNGIYNQHFVTDPAANDGSFVLNIEKGQKSAEFHVTSLNNEQFDNSKVIIFKLTNPSLGLQVGTQTTNTLAIGDDEGPSKVNFAINAGIINEKDANGIVVQIPFTAPAKGTGSMTITLNSANATYGKDFITSPEAFGNEITFNILPNETGASFTVLPIHNFKVTQNLQITFSISTVVGVVWKGTSLTYSLTIINEDQEALVNFAESAGTLDENNTQGIEVEIPFSAQAPGEGSITISLEYAGPGESGYQFTTIPSSAGNNTITLNVSNSQEKVSFKVLPINNSYCNSERYIQFKISFVNGSVKKGSDLDFELTLIDDEVGSVVSFAESAGSINETNSSGVAVQLNFSKPTQQPGSISINSDWVAHKDRLTTTPAYNCYEDYYYGGWYCYDPGLTVNTGATSTMFNISPINNTANEPNYVANFYINAFSSNGCLQTAPNSKYTLTVLDDD